MKEKSRLRAWAPVPPWADPPWHATDKWVLGAQGSAGKGFRVIASREWSKVHRTIRRDGPLGSYRLMPRLLAGGLWVLVGCLALGSGGCDALNPGFINLLDPAGTAGFATFSNAPGHIVVTFINNADVDERLLSFLESAEGGNLTLSAVEKRALRPRIRLRVRVTFADGTFQVIEFIDGSRNLIDQEFDARAFPDLNQNDLSTAVVLCDVASVVLEPGSDIEVFIPVELSVFERVETTTQGGVILGVVFSPRERIPPQFTPLQVDDVDPDGNVILQRNIGVRDVPSPAINPVCGSVIAIVVNGVLAVPFLDEASEVPSFDQDDEPSAASIGGRYEFQVTVR